MTSLHAQLIRRLLSLADLERYFQRAYDEILVPVCGATHSAEYVGFVAGHTDPHYPAMQWRIQGALGFGGKAFTRNDLVINVGCSLIDRTPAREAIICEANEALLKLRAEFLPNNPPAY